MAVIITCKNKNILHIRNLTFESIYENILIIIQRNKLIINTELQSLIDQLYVAGQGIGCDLAKFLKTYETTLYFAQLLNEAIKMYEQELLVPGDEIKAELWNFHKEIEAYAQTLKKDSQ